MNREKKLFEYVITDGPGTMVELGIVSLRSPLWYKEIDNIAYDAATNGYAMQFEPCDDDTETGL